MQYDSTRTSVKSSLNADPLSLYSSSNKNPSPTNTLCKINQPHSLNYTKRIYNKSKLPLQITYLGKNLPNLKSTFNLCFPKEEPPRDQSTRTTVQKRNNAKSKKIYPARARSHISPAPLVACRPAKCVVPLTPLPLIDQ